MKYILPWGLILSRILSGPMIIYLARLPHDWAGPAVVVLIWIAFFLPRWTSDTPSMFHAWRIKKGLPIRRHKLFHGE